MKIEFILSFPRLYIDLYAFGREFYLNFGNFKTATPSEDWVFGPVCRVERISSKEALGGFTTYSTAAGFNAFTREVILCLGTCRYYD